MACEEIGELLQALSHFDRGTASKAQLTEEIVDVQIMLEQLILIHQISADDIRSLRETKLAKLAKQLGGD